MKSPRHHGNYALACLLLAAWMPAAKPASAQHTHRASASPERESRPDEVAFVEQVRAATERFKDRSEAVAVGYRRVGPDMPNMGEHWINIDRVMQRPFDPARPSVLTYVGVDGQPVLTGVAYTVRVPAGEAPPEVPFSGTWHYHTGSLTEEGFGLGMHDSRGQPAHEVPRLAMLHAWIYTPNPDGLFAADNWALSFVRLGIRPPAAPSSAASRALFLAAGGSAYYLDAIRHVATLSAQEEEAVGAILARYRAALEPLAAAMRARGEATGAESEELATLWYALWKDVEAALPSVAGGQLAPLIE